MIGKAEITWMGENPRFVVTSLSALGVDAWALHEEIYSARGETENHIKEE